MANRRVDSKVTDKDTRQHLLETAGREFAEKGFDRVTGKKISEKAGTNTAAVNYYFGSIEGLYAAVVDEAHGKLVSVETLSAAIAGKRTPKAKLQAVLELAVATATGPLSTSWALKIIGREFFSRSLAHKARREREVMPKFRLVRGIVAELMRLPEDHPAVAHGCFCVIAPLAMLLFGERQSLERALPSLGVESEKMNKLAHDMVRYALGGLSSIATQAHGA